MKNEENLFYFRIPGVLIIDLQTNKIVVRISANRRNFQDVSAFMDTHQISTGDYECIMVSE